MLVPRVALFCVARTDGDYHWQSTQEVHPEQVHQDASTATVQAPRFVPAGLSLNAASRSCPLSARKVLGRLIPSSNVPDRNDTLLHASGALVTATSGPRNHMPLLPDCTSSLQVSPAGSSRGSPASAGSELAPGEIAIGDLLELAGVGLGAGVILEHPTDEDFFRDLDDTLDE
ncbi:hypothetical protein BN1723_010945 [Verticillium longisporum]|uniref:Uncharacterized protein n=1 Tax=Verticillium longisporum TaxID=100787 RepID=A0A0G4L358_VERLO|nr:hypothetical protein BN1723_010945 [Verticillium longisporum]